MLKTMPNVGDKVRYKPKGKNRDVDVTPNGVYIIIGIDPDGDATFIDDVGEKNYVLPGAFDDWQLVTGRGNLPDDSGTIALIEEEESSMLGFKLLTVRVDEVGERFLKSAIKRSDNVGREKQLREDLKRAQAAEKAAVAERERITSEIAKLEEDEA